MKTLLLVMLAFAGFASSVNGQVLYQGRPPLQPPRYMVWEETITSRNTVRYVLTDSTKAWSIMFVADGAGRLVGINVHRNGEWVACAQRVGDSWSEASEPVIKPENGMSIDVAAWIAFFKSSVARVPNRIESFGGFQGVSLESQTVWRREVGLVTGDRSGVVRLRNVKTGEARQIGEFEFGILPPVGKDFMLGLSCGLFYAVVGVDDDSKSFLVIAQILEDGGA